MEPVPKPLGGLVLFSTNALIYMDQATTPGLACVVNGYFDAEIDLKPEIPIDGSEPIPVVQQPPSVYTKLANISDYHQLSISLESCVSVFVSPDILLVFLKNGDMVQFDFVGDDGVGRSWKRRRGGVKNIECSLLGISMMQSSSLCCIPELTGYWTDDIGSKYRYGYFFASSLVSDCLLVQFNERISLGRTKIDDDADSEESELYGGSRPIDLDTKNIKYRITDSIVVAAPIRDLTVGAQAKYSSHAYLDDTQLELVACSGDGRDGSLAIFHESIRPLIVSSFEIDNVEDMWSISSTTDAYHKYLFLSRGDTTTVSPFFM